MKIIKVLLLLILISVNAWAQDTDSQKRNISVIILDKKERPIKNVVVKSDDTGKAGITDHSGLFIFSDMSDNDNISLKLPKYGETTIPVAGMDSIKVTLRSRIRYSYVNNKGLNIIIDKEKKTASSPMLDVEALLKQQPFNSLVHLLEGRTAGLNITSGSSVSSSDNSGMVRGANTISGNYDTEPLVVINGIAFGTLSEANAFVNVYDIKTIEINRSGAGWGSRGANGVILITTK